MHAYQHALLLAALLLAASSAGAQTADQQPQPQVYAYGDVSGQQVHVSTTMIVLLAAVVGVFLFIAVSTIYLRHCTGGGGYATERDVVVGRRRYILPAANSFVSRRRPRGLDSSVVRAFPTMKYAEAKALRVAGTTAASAATLECAVCLSEFDDDETLRFLPKCSHAFHPDCIGQWLSGHVTCPVCRRNLDPNRHTTEEVIVPAAAAVLEITNSASSEIVVVRQEDGSAVVIDVVTEDPEDEEEQRKEELELQQIGTQQRKMRARSGRRRPKLLRSHSTGHSLAGAVRLDRDLERFTLRLPEHVHREMVVAAAGEQQRRRGVGEGISLGGGARCSPRFARSGRWLSSFLPSSLSGRLAFFSPSSRRTLTPDSTEVEVSSTSSSFATKVKGKRVAAVDVADGSGHGTAHTVAGSAMAAAEAVDMEKAATRQVRT